MRRRLAAATAARRLTAITAALCLTAALTPPTAFAERPTIDPGRLPAGGRPAPPDKTEQRTICFATQPVQPGPSLPAPLRDLDVEAAWRFSMGAGQTVAVIDTGVSKHPRLPGLIPGGDYVSDKDGTEDCDVHGTVVAGLIAASRVPGEGFAGIAPQARIIAIRQSSGHYQPAGTAKRDEQEGTVTKGGYGNVATLAAAVRHAADMGATVINISEVACASSRINDAALGAAVQYATLVKNVVVVAAAGNKDEGSNCSAGNPDVNPLRPDADLWDSVTTVVSPAWFDDFVLTVGSTDANGFPSGFTVPGPWVDVAAPGERMVSLDARTTGLSAAKMDDKGGVQAYSGTSFATPLVAGVAALVRARFPHLTAQQVMQRIEATAHHPAEGWNPYIGHGSVDALAALTAEIGSDTEASGPESRPMAVPPPPTPPDHGPRNVALIGAGVITVLLVLGVLASIPLRKRYRLPEVGARHV